jgi:hypothetical protein
VHVARVSSDPRRTHLLLGIPSTPRSDFVPMNLFDCAGVHVVWFSRGAKGRFAMFEAMTAMMGLVGAGIFLAHAFEGVRSRA